MKVIENGILAWKQLGLFFLVLCGAVLNGGTIIQDGVVYTTYSTYAVLTRVTDSSSEETLVIPSSINGLPVKEVAKKAFSEVEFDRLVMPDSIQTLKSSAFDACTIKSLSLGNGLKAIEQYAFDDCYGLTSLTVPDSVTAIGRAAFDIDYLESISLPNKCTLASSVRLS